LQHFHQLKAQAPAALASEIIADFHLGKDLLYADLNLKDRRAKLLFRELYDLCLEKTPSPALMIFLSATKDLLVERIRARDCDFGEKIDHEYYGSVNAAYERYFTRYPGKKMRIPMDEWDFVKDPSLYKRLASLIDIQLNSK
jgi:deoxyadenosine/deoxycytidine kinase